MNRIGALLTIVMGAALTAASLPAREHTAARATTRATPAAPELDPLALFPDGRPEAGGEDCPGVDISGQLGSCDGLWRFDDPIGMGVALPGTLIGSCFAGDGNENDAWYQWTNNTGGPVDFIVTTNDPANVGGDSQIVVWSNCAGTVELACNDDVDPVAFTNTLSDTCFFTVGNGQTIYIQFDGWNGDALWDMGLFMCKPSSPFNRGDHCGDAIGLGTLTPRLSPPYGVSGLDIPCGVSDYNTIEPTFGNPLDEAETCFTFTASADGWVQIAASPVFDNSRVILSDDGGLSWATANQCWSNGMGGYDTSPQHGARVTAGRSYCMCVDAYGGVPVVDRLDLWDMEMYYWPLTTQPNVDCASAEPLDLCDGPVTHRGLSTVGAGDVPGVPVDFGCTPTAAWATCAGHGQDLLYTLEFTQEMVNCGCQGFQVTMTSPDLGDIPRVCDAAIQVGTACPITTGSCAATVDDFEPGTDEVAVVRPAVAGTVYTIQADGYMASACPDFDLTVELLDCNPGCDVCFSGCVPTPPTGAVGNAVRAVKLWPAAIDLELSWPSHTVTPANFQAFKTTQKTELAETPTGIGDETPVGAVTTNTAVVDPGVVAAMPYLLFYQVLAADNCDMPVYP